MSVATQIMSQRQPFFNNQADKKPENPMVPPPSTERRPFVARTNLFLNFAQPRRTNNISVSGDFNEKNV